MKLRNFSRNNILTIRNAQRLFMLFCVFVVCGLIEVIENGSNLFIGGVDSSRKNYFHKANKLEEIGFVINTSKCKIPDFSLWDSDIIPFIKIATPLEDCRKTHYNWSSTNGNELIINRIEMQKDGYLFTNKLCCYKIIRRVTQPDDKYDKEADNLISYSSCIPIVQEKTEITVEFLMIECSWSWTKGVGVAYRAFHSFAHNGKSRKLHRKINFWKDQHKTTGKVENNGYSAAPNILVVGLDSTSRINFRRNMFKTKKILDDLGAVEMLGYTKAGESTFPNFCPLFSGYSVEDLQRICYFTQWTKQDHCPLIWKRLDAANYLTAHIEDAPKYTGFNHMRTGFVQQPVDFYVRPLFLAALDYGFPPLYAVRAYNLDCIGYQTNDEIITNYLESTLDTAIRNDTPIFTLLWSTTLSHGDTNMIQLSDDTYADFLQRLIDKGHLENTILFFMGDHGYRYGPVRETLNGYFEDKLPNMWIRLPPKIKDMFPDWQTALEINARRLTSPFHFYWTLNFILDTFTTSNTPVDSFDFNTSKPMPRKHKQNFFQTVPETNSCSDVGVPEEYCACYSLETVKLDDIVLHQAAEIAVKKINSQLVPKCAELKVSKITAGTIIDKTSDLQLIRYIVGFLTLPGEFLFEAEVDYFLQNKTFDENPNVQRANKINQDYVQCAKELELICYCK